MKPTEFSLFVAIVKMAVSSSAFLLGMLATTFIALYTHQFTFAAMSTQNIIVMALSYGVITYLSTRTFFSAFADYKTHIKRLQHVRQDQRNIVADSLHSNTMQLP